MKQVRWLEKANRRFLTTSHHLCDFAPFWRVSQKMVCVKNDLILMVSFTDQNRLYCASILNLLNFWKVRPLFWIILDICVRLIWPGVWSQFAQLFENKFTTFFNQVDQFLVKSLSGYEGFLLRHLGKILI